MMSRPGQPVGLPLHRLTWRFTSFEIGHMKPAPEIYRHVEQATEIPPESIIFFDDSRPNIAAAAERGWRTHLIDPATGDSPAQVRRSLAALITG
jgi:2-haloacid dehalogenase